MNNDKLQRMVENLSEEKFGRTFQHRAYFNKGYVQQADVILKVS